MIAQAEVKSILKASGGKYKALRDAGQPLYQIAPVTVVNDGIVEDVIKEEVQSENSDSLGVSELLSSIGTFDAAKDTADDLKKVKGIGPQMEGTLNQIGIFTFAQVAKMTEREYNLLDSITGSFPGRAQRDDWAGQATLLLNNKK